MAPKPSLPYMRTTASAGRVHFGLSTYSYAEDASDIQLTFECSPARAKAIGWALIGAAQNAERVALSFPDLAPLDDTKAIDA